MAPRQYELKEILALRERREDERLRDMQKATTQLKEAEEQLQKITAELEEFRLQKPKRIDALYQAVLGKTVSRNRLDQLKETVAAIDAEEVALQRQQQKAQQHRQECEKALENARKAYREISKNVVKLTEHREEWRQNAAIEEERDADLELEEFALQRRADDDDSSD